VPVEALLTLGEDTVVKATVANSKSKSASVKLRSKTVEVWNAEWSASNVAEAALQASLCQVAQLLNHDNGLYWDLKIETTATLGDLRPDGHGRLFSGKGFRQSVPHLAVLIEVKTPSTSKTEGVGESCVRAC